MTAASTLDHPMSTLDLSLSRLRPVSLDQVQAAADLQTRIDRKYLVSETTASAMVRALADRTAVLEIGGERDFGYESVYFDTPDLDSYRGSAHGRRRRFKVRTRSYLESGLCVLEVKTASGRGETVKERIEYDLDNRSALNSQAHQFLGAKGLGGYPLFATLSTHYRRSTLLDPDGARATFDAGLICRSPDGRQVQLGDQVLVETKSAGSATTLDRLLWSAGQRPIRVSKYCTGLAALHSDLPANKWNRTLRMHFAWEPARPAHCRS